MPGRREGLWEAGGCDRRRKQIKKGSVRLASFGWESGRTADKGREMGAAGWCVRRRKMGAPLCSLVFLF
jgi:hypothetical protein